MSTSPPSSERESGPSSRSRAGSTSRRAQQRARRRRRNRRIAIGVVALLVVGAVAGFALTRGDDDGGTAQTATRPDTTTPTTPGDTATGDGATTDTTAETPPTTLEPGGPCKPGNLSAAVVTSAVRSTGSVRVVALTNDGRRSCTLEGYPGLTFTGLEGEALTATVTPSPGAGVSPDLGVQTVTVQPTGRASFVMSWDRAGSCLSVGSIGILLPGATDPVELQSLQSVCGNGTVYLSPFQPDLVDA